MAKRHHVVVLSLTVMVALVATVAIIYLPLADNGNVLGDTKRDSGDSSSADKVDDDSNLEPAKAPAVRPLDNVIAVPVTVGYDRQFLVIISRQPGTLNVDERGTTSAPQVALAVYDVEFGGQDARLRWIASRRLEYDLLIPIFGLHRDQMPGRSGDDLSPAGVKRLVERWSADGFHESFLFSDHLTRYAAVEEPASTSLSVRKLGSVYSRPNR